MIGFCVTVLLSAALGAALKIDIVSLNGMKYVPYGGNISLNCFFSSFTASTAAWLQQTPGEKPLLIASAYHLNPVVYRNDFDKSNRFIALRETSSFTLNISHAEPSDSATYYCAVIHYTDVAIGEYTVSVVKDSPSSLYTVLQPPVSDPVQLGGDTTLQCSILTDNSAGDHSVYWFRHGSGESDPGIIFTHGDRSDQCKNSSGTASPTQSCVYKLPKNNLSLSDAGTYYCAVAACGRIVFGTGTKLDFRDNDALVQIILVLATTTIISTVMVLLLCIKLHSLKGYATELAVKEKQVEAWKFAVGGFTNKPAEFKDSEVYSHVIYN